jgi:hypothetical protein
MIRQTSRKGDIRVEKRGHSYILRREKGTFVYLDAEWVIWGACENREERPIEARHTTRHPRTFWLSSTVVFPARRHGVVGRRSSPWPKAGFRTQCPGCCRCPIRRPVRPVATHALAHPLDQAGAQRVSSLKRYRQVRLDLALREFFLALARVGGHQNRKCDRPPGWLVLWRGWMKLQVMLEGYLTAQRKSCGKT